MSNLPPSPTKADYTQDPAYIARVKANATPIFDREDPLTLFSEWMADARDSEPNDSNAMALATTDADGCPDVRMVLLKNADADGFVFYTHEGSDKGAQLSANQNAALCFHWKSLRRQIRVRGPVSRVSEAEADAYFASRARGSQLGAWSSDQSRPISSREQLEQKVTHTQIRFEGQEVTRPPFWYGWRVTPLRLEFWRDRPYRLHDRLLFKRETLEGPWSSQRLQP